MSKVKIKGLPEKTTCILEDTGNGFIAKFPSHSSCHQDYYVCLDYAQAADLYLAFSKAKKKGIFEVE